MIFRLHHYLARSAERSPGALAVTLAGDGLSYGELASRSRRLGRLLARLGIGPGDRVLLLSPKAPTAVMAMHGVLEAGAAYVPVDLQSPASRARMVLETSAPSAILVAAEGLPLLAELRGNEGEGEVPAIALDEGGPATDGIEYGPGDWLGLADGALDVSDGGSDQLAHILFTSGSTGRPKGVQVTHGMAISFVEWALGHFGTSPGERISGHPPLHFDLSTFDVYATLGASAELHLVPAEANLLPRALASFIRDSELHQWFSVPSTLAFMSAAGAIEDGDFPTLKRVLFCGEAMPTPVLAEWMRRVPHASYTNLYGPTEAAIASSYYDVTEIPTDEAEPLPIGYPCPGEQLHVLDRELRPLEPRRTGEIHISGVGLSPGYWREPDKTEAAFVRRPGDGLRLYRTGDLGWIDAEGRFMYSGRLDSQIKHRGFRIELGEIEAALAALGMLAEVAVVAIPTEGFEGTRICCALVPRDEGADQDAIRRELRRSLPAYMIPTEWRALEALPKNASGKIDRRALRESFAERASAGSTARTG